VKLTFSKNSRQRLAVYFDAKAGETLGELAPQFIESVPHDIIGGRPLRYRRTNDGRFMAGCWPASFKAINNHPASALFGFEAGNVLVVLSKA
jgi:hypothetical protein